MNRSTRWFRRLLKLLPSDFQADYGRDMERTFAAQHRVAARDEGSRGLLRLWIETAGDLLRTAPRQHVEQIAQDVRYSLRLMTRRPGFTAVAALVLAFGIGTTTAVFTLADAAVFRPLPFPDADRLLALRERPTEDPRPWELSYPTYSEIRSRTRTLESLAAFTRNSFVIRTAADGVGREPQIVEALQVTADVLTTLRASTAAGRGFREDEDRPGAPRVAMVSGRLAAARFGSPERAVNRTLFINDRPTTIVGVLPATFRFPSPEVDVWIPVGGLANSPYVQNRSVHIVLPVGRMRPNVSVSAARAELTQLMDDIQRREPKADPGHTLIVRPLAEQVSDAGRPAVLALAGAVVLLLAVACISVGLLLLNRASGRTGEMSMRVALGASRARLVRQLFTESVVLACAGAVPGLMAASAVLTLLVTGLERVLSGPVLPTIRPETYAVAVVVTIVTAILCGASPAAQIVRVPRTPSEMSDAGGRRWRHGLLVLQVAFSCVLVVLATLLARSFSNLMAVDPGFLTGRLLSVRTTLPARLYATPDQIARFYRDLPSQLGALPAVDSVTAITRPPIMGGFNAGLTIEGDSRAIRPVVAFRGVLPGYFRVMGIPLVEGREFDNRDPSTSLGAGGEPERVVIVSAAIARRFFPPGQAVGRRIKTGPVDRAPWLRIVGVVGDVRTGSLDADVGSTTYEPHAQSPSNAMTVLVRTKADPRDVSTLVDKTLRRLEPDIIVSAVQTMEERIAESTTTWRFNAVIVGGFAASTLLLASLALYGALSYHVRSRTREIGVRVAIGATRAIVMRQVLRDGLRPAVIGTAAGLAIAFVAARAIRTLLFGVAPNDPLTYVGAAVVLLLAATLACWRPAHRATRIDPSTALRAE